MINKLCKCFIWLGIFLFISCSQVSMDAMLSDYNKLFLSEKNLSFTFKPSTMTIDNFNFPLSGYTVYKDEELRIFVAPSKCDLYEWTVTSGPSITPSIVISGKEYMIVRKGNMLNFNGTDIKLEKGVYNISLTVKVNATSTQKSFLLKLNVID